ncbi:helix-turn-helix transcriptional regulator [Thalassotalea sp. M1531]|uniref:Helix-turn-helix transcriptional regulator n=1 Tax=Thalassotalea algicola TaxID=2716224 RepID=A0A7Y0Q616_9GAMM|nr:AraC family transcriptional regulator [Thalassotalea algicola]NMP30711.1 helix-turn-helix transcriptional regulator [Thalassotalea algicola]
MNLEGKQQITTKELVRTLNDAGYKHTLVEQSSGDEQPMLAGELCFNKLPSGMRIHCTDIVEQKTGKTASEIDAGISINFLLAGSVDFALDNHQYHFSANSKPLIFINVLGQSQIFTRYFKQGMQLRKLNISVSKRWLLSRCQNKTERIAIAQLFANKRAVFQWPCIEDTLVLVEQLFTYHNTNNIGSRLMSEQLAFQLFANSYQLLMLSSKPNVTPRIQRCDLVGKEAASYERKLNDLLYKSPSLAQIASHLGASISTLQRYFKAKHQVTINEYIRHQKLERARRTLIFDKKSIGEVAYIAGYNHTSNFVTAFKKYFKITPAELQKRHLS